MDISLSPQQAQRIQHYLHSGRYATVNEVLEAALNLLEANAEQPRRGEKLLATFEQTGFLGCLPNSDPELSAQYKPIVHAELGTPDDSR